MATLYTLYIGTGVQLPKCYRLQDGTPDQRSIEAAVLFSLDAQDIPGATFSWGRGFWEGTEEQSFKVEVLDSRDTLAANLTGAARSIKRKLNQESILLTSQPVNATFI